MSIAWCTVHDENWHQVQVTPCASSDTVSSIANAVSLQTAIPSDQLVLWFNNQTLDGQTLDMNATLASYAITPGQHGLFALVSPTITSVIRGDETLTVNWSSTVGTNGFGQNIGYYIATASPGSLTCRTTSAASNSCVIHGVSNAEEYSVVVTTVNPGKLPNLETAATQSPATQPPITPTTTQPVTTTLLQPTLASTGAYLDAPMMMGGSLLLLGTLGIAFARRKGWHWRSHPVSPR